MDTDRPIHVDINCTTGAYTETPLTDLEWEAHRTHSDQAAADASAKAEADSELRVLAAAHPDPLVQAMAARLGLT